MQDLEKIIKKASKGHEKSQLRLFEDFYGYAMSVGLRYASNDEDVREIVHDSFIKAFNKLESISDASSFKPWFRRIIINTSIDHFRKHRHEMHQQDLDDYDTEDLQESVIEKMSAEDILALVQKLSPAYRMVFTLYAVEGYKHEEIAQQLGITAGTSKSNLAKARARLQKMVLDEFQFSKTSHG